MTDNYIGWKMFDKVTINNPITYKNYRAKFDNFVNSLNKIPHKNYEEKYPFEFRFVLTLILGYLNKLDSIAIIDCDDPKSYFKDKVSEVLVPNLADAVNKTRLYVKASKDSNLADGMRMVEQWFEEIAKENIPAKELTIADIEKQLGYKIKIVCEEKMSCAQKVNGYCAKYKTNCNIEPETMCAQYIEKDPIIYCNYCFNARVYQPTLEEQLDPFNTELTDENDSSSCSIGTCNPSTSIMLNSGNGKPVNIEFRTWSPKAEYWITVGRYYPKFCPECGRRLDEYEH